MLVLIQTFYFGNRRNQGKCGIFEPHRSQTEWLHRNILCTAKQVQRKHFIQAARIKYFFWLHLVEHRCRQCSFSLSQPSIYLHHVKIREKEYSYTKTYFPPLLCLSFGLFCCQIFSLSLSLTFFICANSIVYIYFHDNSFWSYWALCAAVV